MKTPTVHTSSNVNVNPQIEPEKPTQSANPISRLVLYIKSKLSNISQLLNRLSNFFMGKNQAAATVAAKNPDPASTQNINTPTDKKGEINFSEALIKQLNLTQEIATPAPPLFTPEIHSTKAAKQALSLEKFSTALKGKKVQSMMTRSTHLEEKEVTALSNKQNNFSNQGIKRLCAVIQRDSFRELFTTEEHERWNNLNLFMKNPDLPDQLSPKATQKEIALHKKCTDGYAFLDTIMKQYPDQAAITNQGSIISGTDTADRMQENIVALSMLRTLLDAAADL